MDLKKGEEENQDTSSKDKNNEESIAQSQVQNLEYSDTPTGTSGPTASIKQDGEKQIHDTKQELKKIYFLGDKLVEKMDCSTNAKKNQLRNDAQENVDSRNEEHAKQEETLDIKVEAKVDSVKPGEALKTQCNVEVQKGNVTATKNEAFNDKQIKTEVTLEAESSVTSNKCKAMDTEITTEPELTELLDPSMSTDIEMAVVNEGKDNKQTKPTCEIELTETVTSTNEQTSTDKTSTENNLFEDKIGHDSEPVDQDKQQGICKQLDNDTTNVAEKQGSKDTEQSMDTHVEESDTKKVLSIDIDGEKGKLISNNDEAELMEQIPSDVDKQESKKEDAQTAAYDADVSATKVAASKVSASVSPVMGINEISSVNETNVSKEVEQTSIMQGSTLQEKTIKNITQGNTKQDKIAIGSTVQDSGVQANTVDIKIQDNSAKENTHSITSSGNNGSAESEDWCLECSDEELLSTGEIGNDKSWTPNIDTIVELYDKLINGETLKLQWECPGRRSPSRARRKKVSKRPVEHIVVPDDQGPIFMKDFDFDEDPDFVLTPRRAKVGQKSPNTQKRRQATMDKIMNDIMRHKKIEQSNAASPLPRAMLKSGAGTRRNQLLFRKGAKGGRGSPAGRGSPSGLKGFPSSLRGSPSGRGGCMLESMGGGMFSGMSPLSAQQKQRQSSPMAGGGNAHHTPSSVYGSSSSVLSSASLSAAGLHVSKTSFSPATPSPLTTMTISSTISSSSATGSSMGGADAGLRKLSLSGADSNGAGGSVVETAKVVQVTTPTQGSSSTNRPPIPKLKIKLG